TDPLRERVGHCSVRQDNRYSFTASLDEFPTRPPRHYEKHFSIRFVWLNTLHSRTHIQSEIANWSACLGRLLPSTVAIQVDISVASDPLATCSVRSQSSNRNLT